VGWDASALVFVHSEGFPRVAQACTNGWAAMQGGREASTAHTVWHCASSRCTCGGVRVVGRFVGSSRAYECRAKGVGGVVFTIPPDKALNKAVVCAGTSINGGNSLRQVGEDCEREGERKGVGEGLGRCCC